MRRGRRTGGRSCGSGLLGRSRLVGGLADRVDPLGGHLRLSRSVNGCVQQVHGHVDGIRNGFRRPLLSIAQGPSLGVHGLGGDRGLARAAHIGFLSGC